MLPRNAIAWRNTTSSWSWKRGPREARKVGCEIAQEAQIAQVAQIAQEAPNRPRGTKSPRRLQNTVSCRQSVRSSQSFAHENEVKWNPFFSDTTIVQLPGVYTKKFPCVFIAGKTKQRSGLDACRMEYNKMFPSRLYKILHTTSRTCQNIRKTGVISHLPKISQQGCTICPQQ